MLPSPSFSEPIAEGSITSKPRSRRGRGNPLDDWSAGDEAIDDHYHRNHE